MATDAITMQEDLLGSISGFDGWWEAQRRAASSPLRLALDLRPTTARREAFEFLAGTALSLSSTAPEAAAQGRRVVREPLILPGAGATVAAPRPPLEPERLPVSAVSTTATEPAPPAAAPAAAAAGAPASPPRQLHGTAAADAHLGRGAVRKAAVERPMKPTMAERMHPHHPLFHDARLSGRPSSSRPIERGAAPASPAARGRRPAWDDGSGGSREPGRSAGLLSGGTGLFDARLRPAALAEEERRRRRRAAAAAVPVAELAAQLRRVRETLEHSSGISAAAQAPAFDGGRSGGLSSDTSALLSRLQPYQKAQLRRLSRLDAEVDALRREPLSGSRDAAARRLLQQELQALSADVMPAGGEWPGLEKSLARAAEAAEWAAARVESATDGAVGGAAGMEGSRCAVATGGKAENGSMRAGRACDVFSHSFPSVLSRVEARSRGADAHDAGSGEEGAGGGGATPSHAEMTHAQLAASLRAHTAALEVRLAQAEGTLARAFGAAAPTPQAAVGVSGGDSTGGKGGCLGHEWARDSSLDLDSAHPPWSPTPASVSAFLTGEAHAPSAAPHIPPAHAASRLQPPCGPSVSSAPPGPPPAERSGATGLSQRERGEVLAALSVLDAICSEHDALHHKWVSGSGGDKTSFSSGASCVAALTQESRAQAAGLAYSAALQGGAAGSLPVVGLGGPRAAPGAETGGVDGGCSRHPFPYPSPGQRQNHTQNKSEGEWALAPPRHVALPPRVERSLWRDKAEFERRVRAGGVKEPWRLIERLASDLIEEAIDQTAAELAATADETVDTLCREEFGAA